MYNNISVKSIINCLDVRFWWLILIMICPFYVAAFLFSIAWCSCCTGSAQRCRETGFLSYDKHQNSISEIHYAKRVWPSVSYRFTQEEFLLCCVRLGCVSFLSLQWPGFRVWSRSKFGEEWIHCYLYCMGLKRNLNSTLPLV